MNPQHLLADIVNEVRRYRIALLNLVLADQPELTPRLVSALQSSRVLQLFDANSGDCCVCLRRRELPSTQAVARAVAIQWFCQAESVKRTLLNRHDVERYFPALFRIGLPSGYYVDASNGSPTLGLVRVDTHLTTLPRIRDQTQEVIERHESNPAFLSLTSKGQFEVTWLTPTEAKATGINDVAATLRPSGIRCEARCVPKLLDLLVPLKNTFPDVAGL